MNHYGQCTAQPEVLFSLSEARAPCRQADAGGPVRAFIAFSCAAAPASAIPCPQISTSGHQAYKIPPTGNNRTACRKTPPWSLPHFLTAVGEKIQPLP